MPSLFMLRISLRTALAVLLKVFVLVFVAHALADLKGHGGQCALRDDGMALGRDLAVVQSHCSLVVIACLCLGCCISKPVKHGAMHQALDLFRARSVGNLLKILGVGLGLAHKQLQLSLGLVPGAYKLCVSGLPCATNDVGARRLHFILFLKGLGSALALEVVGSGLGLLRAGGRGLGGGGGAGGCLWMGALTPG